MPGTIRFNGPTPPAGQLFCLVCAGAARNAAVTALAAEVQAATRGDGETVLDLVFDRDIPLAVAWGLFQPMMMPPTGNGMMPFPAPLCWSHLLGLNLQESALMPAHPGMMPTGPGGAVMLDRR